MLVESLSDTVKNDFKKNLSGLEEALNQRITEAETAILESSKAREAMVAGNWKHEEISRKGPKKILQDKQPR